MYVNLKVAYGETVCCNFFVTMISGDVLDFFAILCVWVLDTVMYEVNSN